MGFLLGLPLRLLGLVFGLIRFLIPVALLVLLGIWLYRKYGGHRPAEMCIRDSSRGLSGRGGIGSFHQSNSRQTVFNSIRNPSWAKNVPRM